MSQAALMSPQQALAPPIHEAGAEVAAPDSPRQPPVAEPGWQTTEFWVTLATQIIGLLVVFKATNITSEQAKAIAAMVGLILPQVCYALGRSIRKQGTTG